MRLASIVALFVCTALAGCSSSDSSGAGGGAGTGGSGGAGGGDDAGDAAAADDASHESSSSLAAPVLDDVVNMAGALHIFWTNVQTDCDSVRIERKSDTEAWVEKAEVAGTLTNKMDGSATADTTYTYRLRCEKAGEFSDYSNEVSKNPTQ